MTTPKQQAKNRKIWIDALRSGKYKQAKSRLKKGDAFCCLGVACDVFKDDVGGSWVGDFFAIDGAMRDTYLPYEVVNVLGLSNMSGDFSCPGFRPGLAVLNDKLKKTFSEIADVIESEPDGLLVSKK